MEKWIVKNLVDGRIIKCKSFRECMELFSEHISEFIWEDTKQYTVITKNVPGYTLNGYWKISQK